jgi:uncharacterized membrane protein
VDVTMQAATTVKDTPVERMRLLPIDWLRGLVMVLMTVDHASDAFNGGRLFGDSTLFYRPGSPLPPDQFFTRWISHLCAPTFVFLAGFVLLLSVERRRRDGQPEGSITRFIVTRGLIIAALDPLWMVWVFGTPSQPVLQVLYAIGMSFVALAFLRRLPPLVLGAIGLALCVVDEPLAASLANSGPVVGALLRLLLVPGYVGPFLVGYPLIPWLAIMLLGWAAADIARREPERFRRWPVVGGLGALVVFGVVRGLNGFGNAGLLRGDGSIIQWLHTSKYPPSLAYTACELGLAWLLLAALSSAPLPRWIAAVLTPLGQNAFFFYLLHVHLLVGAAWLLGLHHKAGLGATYLSAAIVIAVLLPACRAYGRYKRAHPNRWAQYI